MKNISTHISLEEATNSPTAKRLGFANKPTEDHIKNMEALATTIFEVLRKGLGDHPIRITSFYRSEESNKAVGGATASQHCKGEAMDLQGVNATNAEVFEYIKDHLPFDQMIWEFGTNVEPAWVHVSYSRKSNRGKVLKALKKNGKTVYEIY